MPAAAAVVAAPIRNEWPTYFSSSYPCSFESLPHLSNKFVDASKDVLKCAHFIH